MGDAGWDPDTTPKASKLNWRKQHTLTGLPRATFERVLQYLPAPDLAALLRVSREMHNVILPALYRHTVLSANTWPFSSQHPPSSQPSSHHSKHPPRPSPASQIHTLTIHAHSTLRCIPGTFAPTTLGPTAASLLNSPALPPLPALKTLIVHSPLHTDDDTRFWLPHGGPVPQCNVLNNLRPAHLVLLGAPGTATRSLCTVLPYGVLTAVEQYTLVLPPDAALIAAEGREVPILRAWAIVADLMNANLASRATIVFQTAGPEEDWHSGPRRRLDGEWRQAWAGVYFGELARCLARLGRTRVLFVNVGALDRTAVGSVAWDPEDGQRRIEGHFLDVFEDELQRLRIAGRSPKMRAGDVMFESMESYLSRNEWRDVSST